jgi:hypothetical protein
MTMVYFLHDNESIAVGLELAELPEPGQFIEQPGHDVVFVVKSVGGETDLLPAE